MQPEEGTPIVGASMFRGLSRSSRHAIDAAGRVERLHRGDRIAEQGAPMRLFVLLDRGRVRLERRTGDRALPVAYRGPGELVGETGVLGGVAGESATVVEATRALVLPMPAFQRLVDDDASIRAALMEGLLGLRVAAERRLEGLLLLDVQARLMSFLQAAAGRWGAPHPDGVRLAATFTHAEIAAVIGATRETVTLLLGRLRREGRIAMNQRAIILREGAPSDP